MYSLNFKDKHLMIRRVGRDWDRGATSVEYGLFAAFIVGVIIVLLVRIGQQVTDLFGSVGVF